VAANVSSPGAVFYRPGITTNTVRFGLYSDSPAPNNANLNLYTLNADWKSPIGMLTSITNYTKFNAFNVQDVDELPQFLLTPDVSQTSWQYSEETARPFFAGRISRRDFGSFLHELAHDVDTITLLNGIAPGILTTQHVFSGQKTEALFGQV